MIHTPNPTSEQILVDEWIRQADRAKSMTGMDAIWFPDAEETLAVLRANGLLSEGTPSEEQARAIRKLDNVQAILAGAQASVTDAVRELSLTSAALVAAAGAAPQAETPQCGPCRRGQHGCCDGNEYLRCDCGHVAPVLPSSGVDEAALAEVIARVTDLWDDPLDEVHDIPQIARAVAEWLKGQGR